MSLKAAHLSYPTPMADGPRIPRLANDRRFAGKLTPVRRASFAWKIRSVSKLTCQEQLLISVLARACVQPRSSPLISKLPIEILILIFRLLDREIIDPSVPGKRKRDDLRVLPLVCKTFYGPATHVLYEVVDLSRVSSVFKFHRSLVDRPHLRSMVKTLALPGRVWRTCPARLMKVFLHIIDLVESLETLYATCQLVPFTRTTFAVGDQVVLPFATTKHRDLRYIDLYASSWNRCVFPSLIASSFEKLEWLALYGFCLNGNVDPATTPPLPNLTTVSCLYGDVIKYLDGWLQTCPKLGTLLLRDTYLNIPSDDTPPLGLLQQGLITHLKLNQMYLPSADGDNAFNWLSKCDSLSVLELDWDAFSRLSVPLPASVDTMIVRIEYDEPTLWRIVAFLGKNRAVKNFEWRACKHDKWYNTNRPVLLTLMQDFGVTMIQDQIPCFCLRESHFSIIESH